MSITPQSVILQDVSDRHDFVIECSPGERVMMLGYMGAASPEEFAKARRMVEQFRAEMAESA
jgi:hypothetical protein